MSRAEFKASVSRSQLPLYAGLSLRKLGTTYQMAYRAPVADYQFLLREMTPIEWLGGSSTDFSIELDDCDTILEAAGSLAEERIAPLQYEGDIHPARLENGVVRTPPQFADGYDALREGAWIGMSADEEFGGMALPGILQNAVCEMINGACMALGLNVLLTQGQIEALSNHASESVKKMFLPNLVSGNWSGTMNMTEPHAGSDIGALKTKAEPDSDGTYRITGQKIYISWGDCDFVENVCHLVLARLPGAPKGSKGISLFLVPKRLPDADGELGHANSLKVVGLERKLGIHGSPTATIEFAGAKGWIVGAPNSGLRVMFDMMNYARLAVGFQGVAVAEAAAGQAAEYALSRVQGRPVRSEGMGTVIGHADVRRTLLKMRAQIFAARAICASCAFAEDMAVATGDESWRNRSALLTPLAKSFGSDTGVEVALQGIQVMGGAGYIEDSGSAQFLRDVLVTTIYEGTNGIQAMDLVARKMADDGKSLEVLIEELETSAAASMSADGKLSELLKREIARFRKTITWMLKQNDMNSRFAGSRSFLRALALLLGADFHLRALTAEAGKGRRSALARVYFNRFVPFISSCCDEAEAGDSDLYEISADELGCWADA